MAEEQEMDVKQQILEELLTHPEGITTGDLADATEMERHTLAKHLGILKNDCLVSEERDGPAKIWTRTDNPLRQITERSGDDRSYAETILMRLMENIPTGIAVVDDGYEVQFANAELTAMYGEITGEPFYDSVLDQSHPLSSVRRLFQRRDERIVLQETDYQGRSLEIRGVPLRTGGLDAALLLVDDITERQRAFEELQRKKDEFKKIFELSNEAMVCIDYADARIKAANDTAASLLGYDKEDLEGMDVAAIYPDERDEFLSFAETVDEEGEGRTDTLTCTTQNGEVLCPEISAYLIYVDRKKCIMALIRDVDQ